MVESIDAQLGEKVKIPLDFSGVLGENSIEKLFALMLMESETGYVNFYEGLIEFDGKSVSLKELGLLADESKTLYLDYTIS